MFRVAFTAIAVAVASGGLLTACGGGGGSSTALPTVSSRPTFSPTSSPSPSKIDPTPTVAPSAVPTHTPTVSPSGSPTATPSAAPSGSPAATPSATPTAAPVATPTPTPAALNVTQISSGLNTGAKPYAIVMRSAVPYFTDGGSTNAIGFISAGQAYELATSSNITPFGIAYSQTLDKIYFTEATGLELDQFNSDFSGGFTRISLPIRAPSYPRAVVASDTIHGTLWIASGTDDNSGSDESILAYDPITASVSKHPLSSGGFDPWAETIDSQGNVWIAERNASQVQEMNSSGTIVATVKLPARNGVASRPVSLVQASDGNIWVADSNQSALWKITSGLAPQATAYAITPGCKPQSIIATGRVVWFSENGCNGFGKMSTAGVYNDYRTSILNGAPNRLTIDYYGNIWYTDTHVNAIFTFRAQ